MSVRVMDQLEQRSPEWHDQRRGMVTASAVGRLITGKTMKPAANDHSRALTCQLVAERITGHTEDTFISGDMIRGIEDEPYAVQAYESRHAPVTSAGFIVRDDWGFSIGYSPDGLVGDDGLIEVKSRRQDKQVQHVVAAAVPSENMAQLQCGLLVSGRSWCDYVSYSAGMRLWVKRVHVDPDWATAIVEAVRLFEQVAAGMIDAYCAEVKGAVETERREGLIVGLS